MMQLKTDRMIAQQEGAIGWITFNNPARHNAVSLAMWEALHEIVAAYARDDSIRVIVVKGAGDKAFVSGADISEFEEKRSTEETTRAYHEVSHRASDALQFVNKPTIAMIRGYCDAYGLTIDDDTLRARAIEWAQTRGARSGRVAIQFVRALAGEMGKAI